MVMESKGRRYLCGECEIIRNSVESLEKHMQSAHDMTIEESRTYVAAVKLITEMTPP
ncbi:MAG: hypothetical protein UT24_C0003G0061 [Candidatus Woesebacteria bacterium GW2011_GWB1_39_12]|uniref:C2H2-type domain-containing protein n=1 Tax=Candidatus Woesebacteria bacterium GW2011_GWB1_39_12 TaxID=1618574 RepID=A0A0G0MC95_9BACT|nr:MAG: hypothetical protein UT24_C0003G0061 [Candidatus Woesebacteria bacterium GW2011_GWB1_39_12]